MKDLIDALKRILIVLDDVQDVGPIDEGWKSNQLISDMQALEDHIKTLESSQ